MNSTLYNRCLKYALSDVDVQNIVKPYKTNIIEYPDLAKVNSINDILDNLGRVIIFIKISPSFGHWTCLIKRGNTLNWFDSYGIKYDDEKNWMSKKKLIEMHELQPLLTQLLQKEHQEHGTKILYNHYHWQSENAGVSTCGRWAGLICKWYDKTFEEINKMIKASKMTPDQFVILKTYEIIGK